MDDSALENKDNLINGTPTEDVKLQQPRTCWDDMLEDFGKIEEKRNKLDLDEFSATYAVLFSNDIKEMDQDDAAQLVFEYMLKIDPYREVKIFKHHNNPEVESIEVLTLPAMLNRPATFNETPLGGAGNDIFFNLLNQYTNNEFAQGPHSKIPEIIELLSAASIKDLFEYGNAEKYLETLDNLKEMTEDEDGSKEKADNDSDDLIWD